MMFKFGSDPKPGYYDDGRLVLAPRGKVVTASTKGDRKALASSGSFGFDSGAGVGYGSGYGSSADINRMNPVRDRLDEGSVAEDWIPRDAAGMDAMFRLFYHRDHVAGTIVDIITETIWSDYDLVGVKDPAILKIYEDTCSSLDAMTTLPNLNKEYLVSGRTVSSLLFDKSRGIFTDIVAHDPDFLQLEPIPMRGFDPKINLIPSPALRAFVMSKDPRDQDALSTLPSAFIEAIRKASGGMLSSGGMGGAMRGGMSGAGSPNIGGGIPLDPINTLFVARKVFQYDYIGTSLYTRLINFWALEKALINATITSARRRARSILHVTAGIEGSWDPTPAEMDSISDSFQYADEDPVGAVVVTRSGVGANEVRSGQDFYKWSDEWQLLSEGKLRALGANDALLSGDATYSNQENAREFFMERALNLRTALTQRIFYKKLFALTARVHGFHRRTQAELNHNIRVAKPKTSHDDESMTQSDAMSIPESDLIFPTIQYRKELVNHIDEKRLDIYERMDGIGLPITLQNWASAANIDLDSLMTDLEADAELRKKIAHWRTSYEEAASIAENEAKLEFVKSLKSLAQSHVYATVQEEDDRRALGPLAQYTFWPKSAVLGGMKAIDLAKFIRDNKDGSKVKVLFDPFLLVNRLRAFFQNDVKASVAHYLLYRTGVTPVCPKLADDVVEILSTAIRNVLDEHAVNGKVYELSRVAEKELKMVANCHERFRERKVADISAAASRISAKTLTGKAVRRDPLPSSSPQLYSGIAKD
jgi:hypothetical protein